MKESSGPRLAVVALWVVFAVVAVASGGLAVRLVGGAITPSSVPVLSSEEVSRRLVTASPVHTRSPTPEKTTRSPKETRSRTASNSPSPTPTRQPAVVRTLSSSGGSVVAACSEGDVTLRSVSPAVGFRVDELEEGGDEAEVRFVSSSAEVKLSVRCEDGVPRAETEVDEESGDDD